jgi:hypothetical protein
MGIRPSLTTSEQGRGVVRECYCMRLTMLRLAVCFVFAAPLLVGCAGPQNSAARQRGPVCDEATGRAVAAGNANARGFAQGALRYQIQDLRGYMAQEGLRNVAVQSQRVDCKPYVLGFVPTGLKLCVATARLCGQ